MTRIGVAAALVDGVRVAGDVRIEGGRIAEVGVAPAAPGGLAVPGLVDLQVNGAGGVDFLAAGATDHARAAAALAAEGVTAYRPTLISAPPGQTREALREAAGAPLRAHLEGPFLSPRWPGAQPPEHLGALDPSLLGAEPAPGAVTLAPELPGGLELVTALHARGIVIHLGHTDATAATAHAAFDRGARALTHAFNAHRRFGHRDPGPAGAALARDDVIVTAILDGAHLAPETEALLWRAARGRLCLISDGVAQTLGGRPRPPGRLAGSTVPLIAGVRRLVALGAPLEEAVGAATAVPARLVPERPVGRLAPGLAADVCVLDDRLEVVRTLVAGEQRG